MRIPFSGNPLTLNLHEAGNLRPRRRLPGPAPAGPDRGARSASRCSIPIPTVVYLEQTLQKADRAQGHQGSTGFFRQGGQQPPRHPQGRTRPSGWRRSPIKTTASAAKAPATGISGWVAPWAFSSTDPEFVANLKQLYERQIQVQKLIADKQVAVGMTLDEVSVSQGQTDENLPPQNRHRPVRALGVHRIRGRQKLRHRDRPHDRPGLSPAGQRHPRGKGQDRRRVRKRRRHRGRGKRGPPGRQREDHRPAVGFPLVRNSRDSTSANPCFPYVMALHCPDSMSAVADLFTTMTPAKLERLGDVYGPGIAFHDPIHDARGLPQLRDVLSNRFKKMAGISFKSLDAHGDDRTGFLLWIVNYQHRGERAGHPRHEPFQIRPGRPDLASSGITGTPRSSSTASSRSSAG